VRFRRILSRLPMFLHGFNLLRAAGLIIAVHS
jgi:hypothetical protein